MVRWPSKGPVRVYLCDSRDNLRYDETGKDWEVKRGAFDEKKYGGKTGDMPRGSRYESWTRKRGEGSK